jgi:hypothetical protein
MSNITQEYHFRRGLQQPVVKKSSKKGLKILLLLLVLGAGAAVGLDALGILDLGLGLGG